MFSSALRLTSHALMILTLWCGSAESADLPAFRQLRAADSGGVRGMVLRMFQLTEKTPGSGQCSTNVQAFWTGADSSAQPRFLNDVRRHGLTLTRYRRLSSVVTGGTTDLYHLTGPGTRYLVLWQAMGQSKPSLLIFCKQQ